MFLTQVHILVDNLPKVLTLKIVPLTPPGLEPEHLDYRQKWNEIYFDCIVSLMSWMKVFGHFVLERKRKPGDVGPQSWMLPAINIRLDQGLLLQ